MKPSNQTNISIAEDNCYNIKITYEYLVLDCCLGSKEKFNIFTYRVLFFNLKNKRLNKTNKTNNSTNDDAKSNFH